MYGTRIIETWVPTTGKLKGGPPTCTTRALIGRAATLSRPSPPSKYGLPITSGGRPRLVTFRLAGAPLLLLPLLLFPLLRPPTLPMLLSRCMVRLRKWLSPRMPSREVACRRRAVRAGDGDGLGEREPVRMEMGRAARGGLNVLFTCGKG